MTLLPGLISIENICEGICMCIQGIVMMRRKMQIGENLDAFQIHTGMTNDIVLVLVKAAHWSTGVAIVAVLIDLLHS